ncbi:hypothetical protein A2U01_0062634, partial [Trifolium medium]|nr:hypothetical protein [Trifolium medium]
MIYGRLSEWNCRQDHDFVGLSEAADQAGDLWIAQFECLEEE